MTRIASGVGGVVSFVMIRIGIRGNMPGYYGNIRLASHRGGGEPLFTPAYRLFVTFSGDH